jgi:hypothetical protein
LKRVRYRDRKRELDEARYNIALCLFQKKTDPPTSLTIDQVRALTPREKRALRLKGRGANLSYDDFINLRLKPF